MLMSLLKNLLLYEILMRACEIVILSGIVIVDQTMQMSMNYVFV